MLADPFTMTGFASASMSTTLEHAGVVVDVAPVELDWPVEVTVTSPVVDDPESNE